MKKEAEHLLVNKIECLHLQHLLREEQTLVETFISIKYSTTGNTQEANLTGYLSRKNWRIFSSSVRPSTSVKRLLNMEPPKSLSVEVASLLQRTLYLMVSFTKSSIN
jgi:hypothetical protein